jgi:hypothetical protein
VFRRFRPKLTYANVISTTCLFILLGGGAYAVTNLPVNSVGTAQIKNAAVTQQKISRRAQAALTGQKGDRGPPGPATGAAGGSLAGTYPNPSLAPPEPFHAVTSFGECDHPVQWETHYVKDPNFATVGFYRDPYGVVHLRGSVDCNGMTPLNDSEIFYLPAGYTPALAELFAGSGAAGPTEVEVASNGSVLFPGIGPNPGAGGFLSLDGISFRCEPSGVSGCP